MPPKETIRNTRFKPILPRNQYQVVGVDKENQFWSNFSSPTLIKEHNSVTSLNFSPISPYDFVASTSARVQVYSSRTPGILVKSISRFTDTVQYASYRGDGKLIVAGDNTGLIQVFDVNSRVVLRSLKEHKGPVHSVKFHSDITKVVSASDDKLVKLWDIPSQSSISTFTGHTDYIRSLTLNPSDPNLIMSGSYDGTVRIFDTRINNKTENSCTHIFNHIFPVQDLVVYPSGSLLAVAGGPQVQIYDLIAGKAVHCLANFQKDVTCLALDGNKKHLLAGSLDNHVKFFDLDHYHLQHSIKYPSPVLSLALPNDNSAIAVGMVNGSLSVRRQSAKRIDQEDAARPSIAKKALYLIEEGDLLPNTTDIIKFKDNMRLFKYSEALEQLLRRPKIHKHLIIEQLRELIRRGALQTTLMGINPEKLVKLMDLLGSHITHVHYRDLAIKVLDFIIDTFDEALQNNPMLAKAVTSLHSKVQLELVNHNELVGVVGLAELLIAKSQQ